MAFTSGSTENSSSGMAWWWASSWSKTLSSKRTLSGVAYTQCFWSFSFILSELNHFNIRVFKMYYLSYISNRHQRVKIKGSRSEWREVKKKGVPQGTIIGTLILIYSLMTCFILLTNVHCTTTQTTTPYLLLPHVFLMLFKLIDRLQQYHRMVFCE